MSIQNALFDSETCAFYVGSMSLVELTLNIVTRYAIHLELTVSSPLLPQAAQTPLDGRRAGDLQYANLTKTVIKPHRSTRLPLQLEVIDRGVLRVILRGASINAVDVSCSISRHLHHRDHDHSQIDRVGLHLVPTEAG